MTINIKSAEDIEAMRHACRLASEVLDYIAPTSNPASPPKKSTAWARSAWPSRAPSPPPWATSPGLPALPRVAVARRSTTWCATAFPTTSPRKGRHRERGRDRHHQDGWYGDNSRMYLIGECSIAAKRLSAVTFEAMWHGILQVKPGARLGDIGHAIQKFAEGHGFSVVREFCGHGIGQKFHEEPQVCTAARHAGRAATRHGVHHRAHDQRRQARCEEPWQRRLDASSPGCTASLPSGEHTVLVTPRATR